MPWSHFALGPGKLLVVGLAFGGLKHDGGDGFPRSVSSLVGLGVEFNAVGLQFELGAREQAFVVLAVQHGQKHYFVVFQARGAQFVGPRSAAVEIMLNLRSLYPQTGGASKDYSRNCRAVRFAGTCNAEEGSAQYFHVSPFLLASQNLRPSVARIN